MGDLRRTQTRSLLLVAALISLAPLMNTPVFGQGVVGEFVPDVGFDLSGNWNPLLHEDFLERIPGPELVNYSGLPITEGSRLWGESWNSSRLTMPEHQCQVHVSPYIYRGPLQMRFWDEKDPQSQKIIAIKNYISTYEQTRTIWMDGRPHPPAWAAHTWMGFSTGKWEGNYSDGLHHAHQAGLGAARRSSGERSGHAGGTLHPARRPSHARQHRDRSGVSHRAAGQVRGLPAEHQRRRKLAVSRAKKWKKWKGGREARCRIICPARIRFIDRVREHVSLAADRGSGRTGDDVSRVREGDQEPASGADGSVAPEGRDRAHAPRKTWRRIPSPPTAKFTFFRCRATSTCWWARAATSRLKWATWAC